MESNYIIYCLNKYNLFDYFQDNNNNNTLSTGTNNSYSDVATGSNNSYNDVAA